jgi:hypothetical protein
MDEPRLLEFPQGFLQNFSFGPKCKKESMSFLVCGGCEIRVGNAEESLKYHLLIIT